MGQGFLLGKPMTAPQLDTLVAGFLSQADKRPEVRAS
jgi:EAL domain-containing protein (putative c-di-GMP-specific phosphodiesterase class I)